MANAAKAKVIEFIDKNTGGVIHRISDPAVVSWLDTKSILVEAMKETEEGFQGGTVRVPIGGYLDAKDIRLLVKLLQNKKVTYKNGVMRLNEEPVDVNHLAQLLAYLSVPEEDIISILKPLEIGSNNNTTYTEAENRINQLMAGREKWLRENAERRALRSRHAAAASAAGMAAPVYETTYRENTRGKEYNVEEYPWPAHTRNMTGAEFEKYLRTEMEEEDVAPYPKIQPLPKQQRNRNNYSNVISLAGLFGANEGGRRRVRPRKTRKGLKGRKARKTRKTRKTVKKYKSRNKSRKAHNSY